MTIISLYNNNVCHYVVILIICQHHFQSRENESCHVLCSSCPYFEVGVARTVPNSHVIELCSIPLVFSQSGVLRTVSGAAQRMFGCASLITDLFTLSYSELVGRDRQNSLANLMSRNSTEFKLVSIWDVVFTSEICGSCD